MATITFLYNTIPTKILCQRNEKFEEIFQKFSTKISINVSELYFIYGKQKINAQLTFNQVAKNEDKNQNQMTILVYSSEKSKKDEENKTVSLDIICPECGDNSLINIKDYKIQFSECKKGHKINDISLEAYNSIQIIDESKIVCENCKSKNKASSFNKEFFVCLQCKKNICPICKSSHNNQHDIINYNQLKFICLNHNEKFNSFCKKCKINLCMECESGHKDKENLIYLRDILPNKDIVRNQLNELNTKINQYKEKINDLKNVLDKIILNLETYYKISDNLLKNYEKKLRNFYLLKNINEFHRNNTFVINDLNQIINDNNPINLFKLSINIINKIGIKFNGKSFPVFEENKSNEIKDKSQKNIIDNNNEINNKYNNITKDKNNYEKFVYLSMLAEQCSLYTDEKYFLEIMIKNRNDVLLPDERNLFAIACKNYISTYRKALRTIEAYKNKEKKKSSSFFLSYIMEYQKLVENDTYKLCQEIIQFLDDNFIKKLSFKGLDDESKVFYLKMKADYNKYLAEAEIFKEKTTNEAKKNYDEGLKISQNLPIYNSVRLGLLLNFSVFIYEVINDHKKAIEIAKSTIEKFNKEKKN